jgi:hypothetical protein
MKFFSFFSFIKVLYFFFHNIISITPVMNTKGWTGIYFWITIYSFTFLVSHYLGLDIFEILNQVLVLFMYLIAHVLITFFVKKNDSKRIKISSVDKFNFMFYMLIMLCCTIWASSFLELPQH